MKKKYKIIIVIITIILTILSLFGYYSYSISKINSISTEISFTVTRGEGLENIIIQATKQGLINSPRFAKTYAEINNLAPKIKSGNYIFSKELSVKTFFSELLLGEKKSGTYKLTIPEGLNIAEIDKTLALKGRVNLGDFSKYTKSEITVEELSNEFVILNDKPLNATLEGYLFPDTYMFYENADSAQIATKMLSNLESKITPDLRQEITRQGKTVYEILTMASILEKEVRSEGDMKLVSDLFWRRISNGQPLQSCATLAYILGIDKPQYSIEDTKIDSPYNTYKVKGLTPGPIGNPGIKAIKAAIFSTPSEYNFFLTDSRTGETIFSKTYQEHLINKAKHID